MSSESSIIYYCVPKFVTVGFLSTVVGNFNRAFLYKGLQHNYFKLDFSSVCKVDVLGILLIYKFLEYIIVSKSFRGQEHNIYENKYLLDRISEYGFEDLIRSLTNVVEDKEYKKLRIAEGNNCLIAPIALIRSNHDFSEDILKNQYEPQVKAYYSSNHKASDMILQVFTEILHNFWAHATDDRSVIVGYGTKDVFEIACIDNGLGIDGTMRTIYSSMSPQDAVLSAMQKGRTSKQGTNHMGYGLWFINQIITRVNGNMSVVSNNVYYENKNGYVKNYISTRWNGTIVYLRIPLKEPVTIADIEDAAQFNELKINFQ